MYRLELKVPPPVVAAALIDSGAIRPVVDRVFPFESTKEAVAYVEKGRAKGKVVVKVK
jgi:alcohol dehydrogenase